MHVKAVGARFTSRIPNRRGTFVRVSVRRTIIYWSLYWGPVFFGNYRLPLSQTKENLLTTSLTI